MKPTSLLGLAVFCICAVAPAAAQENIRLHFELYKNGKQVGTPAVTVKNSETGSVELGNMGNAKLSFTPTRTDREKIGIAFVIATGRNTLKPHVTLLRGESGWVSWKSGSDSFDVRVFVVPRELMAPR
ncbi:MAG TPA: hypothetical protein VF456_01700 [Vicinamibacterales bacterium]